MQFCQVLHTSYHLSLLFISSASSCHASSMFPSQPNGASNKGYAKVRKDFLITEKAPTG